jgi:Rieske Fe-S protein
MDVERRTVLQAGGLIAVGGLVAACSSGGSDVAATSAAASAPAASAPAASNAASGTTGGTVLAQVTDVPVGGGVIIADPAVVITQPADGDIKAFSAICTHQGCLVGEVADNEIICPCHGSRFSATDGTVLQGPAQSPLEAAPVTVENGSVVLG